MSTKVLEREITELAARIASETCRWLLMVAEFERREGHLEFGFHCCAVWLSWRCSVAPRAAREQLRVARRLTDWPLVREAFSRGELSYSKVRAITRVEATELEQELVELAQHASAAQLERIVRAYRGAASLESARAAEERRRFDYHWEVDGSLSFRGRLAPEEGALLLRALEAGRDALNAERWAQAGDSAGQSPVELTTDPVLKGSAEPRQEEDSGSAEPWSAPSPRVTNADAVVAIAESMLAAGPGSRSGGERHQVVVHVDAEVLAGDGDRAAGGSRNEDGRCELEHGPAISAETARRLSCDAAIVAMLEGADGSSDSNGALDVGRKTRAISPATRRALHDRDGGCCFPGCQNHRFVDGHHIQHWAAGGETKLDNLVQLCRRHHRLVHEEGFSVERAPDGAFVFRRPDGEPLPAAPRLPRADRPADQEHHAERRRRSHASPVAGAIPIPRSAGQAMDLGLTVGGLMERTASAEGAGPAP